MSKILKFSTNTAVLSARNIRRKSTKYLKKQLGENMTKEEFNRLIGSGKIQVTGLISKN